MHIGKSPLILDSQKNKRCRGMRQTWKSCSQAQTKIRRYEPSTRSVRPRMRQGKKGEKTAGYPKCKRHTL